MIHPLWLATPPSLITGCFPPGFILDTTSASQTLQRAAAVVEYPDDFPASISRYLNSESRGSGISVSRVDIYFDDDYKQAKLCDPIIKKYATQ